MSMTTLDITTVRLPQRTLAYVRHVGPYMGDTELFSRLFGVVFSSLKARGLLESNAEGITVYHDDADTVPASKQRISVGCTVPHGTQANDGLDVLDLPESDYVVGSFEISPDQYPDAWTDMFAYMGENGLAPSAKGVMYESYKNDPSSHPEGKHVVDICVAVDTRVGS